MPQLLEHLDPDDSLTRRQLTLGLPWVIRDDEAGHRDVNHRFADELNDAGQTANTAGVHDNQNLR